MPPTLVPVINVRIGDSRSPGSENSRIGVSSCPPAPVNTDQMAGGIARMETRYPSVEHTAQGFFTSKLS